jgi:hypothetical protein
MRSEPARFAGISLERGEIPACECTTGLARQARLEICVLYSSDKQEFIEIKPPEAVAIDKNKNFAK